MNFLILIFVIFFFFLSWRRLDWAVLFLIAALPTYLIRFKIFGAPFTLLEAMILIIFAAWLITNFNELKTNLANLFKRNNKKIKISYPFQYEIILLLIISFFSAGIAGFSNEALGIWKAYFFEPILLFIVIINIFKVKDLNKIIYALATSSFIVSFAAIWQKIFFSAERAVSFFGYPNAVGLYLGPIILLLLGLCADKIYFFKNQKSDKDQTISNFQTIIIFLAVIFSVAAIYFAKSEGALVGIAAGFFVFGLLAGRKARIAAIIIILIALAGIYFSPLRSAAIKKITLNDFSGQVRKQQWQETWKMLKDGRILMGSGLANYQKIFAPYHAGGFYYNKDNDPDFMRKIVVWGKDYWKKVWQPVEIYLYPHNIFLNFWSELGLAGMLLFVWVIGKFFYVGVKIIENCIRQPTEKIENLKVMKSKYIVLGLICAMVVTVVHGFVDVPYFKNDLAVMFWVLLAIMGIIDLELKMEKK